ncbi:MAG: dual specificity protein phosphatase family protein [Lentisphaeraceae bacterium]|nr:dual specificity protein phosphatase family protein [Lentisphaeraceae bacterium]
MSHYDKIWWLEENSIGGMPKPPADEIAALYNSGLRAVGSFLEGEDNLTEYTENNLEYCWLAVEDDKAPSLEQVKEFSAFVEKMKAAKKPLAVHCKGGNGRAGTMLASYYVLKGQTAKEVLEWMRSINPKAVRTQTQEDFLKDLENKR